MLIVLFLHTATVLTVRGVAVSPAVYRAFKVANAFAVTQQSAVCASVS